VRTTLELDDAVLAAARVLAAQRGISLGAAVSEYARRGLQAPAVTSSRNGFPVFGSAPSGHVITDDLVAEHRDD
jgi:hypothetical protein